MTTREEFESHIRVAEGAFKQPAQSVYVEDEEWTVWLVDRRIQGYCHGRPGESTGYTLADGCARMIYQDGELFVIAQRHSVLLRRVGGACFHIPKGHAWHQRVIEACTRSEVMGHYSELCALMT